MAAGQRVATVVGIVLVVLLTAAVGGADPRESYTEGIRAMDKGEWQEAARWMRRAIDEDPAESDKRIRLYGMRFEPYVPHYQLGVALQEAGDCRGALAAFAESLEQGVIQGLDKFRDLERRRDECGGSLPPPTATATATPAPPATPTPPPFDTERFRRLEEAAQQAISRAENAAREVAGRRDSRDFAAAWSRNPQLATRQQQAGEAIAVAKSKLAAAAKDRSFDDLEDARRLAAQAEESLGGVSSTLEAAKREIEAEQRRQREAALERLRNDVRQLVPAAREALATGDELSSNGQRQVADTASRLRQLVDQASTLPSSLGPAELESLREQLARATESHRRAVSRRLAEENKPVPPTPTPVPTATPLPSVPPGLPMLRGGVDAFLKGDYQGAVERLDAESLVEPREAAVGYLVRAAARYYLYLEGGEDQEDLLEEARDDIRACRRTDRTVAPLPELFSPRFVRLFEKEG